jgi:hypothetical protein
MSHLWGDDDDEEDNVQNNDEVDNDPNEEEEEVEDEEDVLDMEGTTINTQIGALLMRFCPHDSSMLYPQVLHIICILH